MENITLKTSRPVQHISRNFKTHNSTWTPVVHKPSNHQIFEERCNLISHWFDLWTDNQRKSFLQVIFHSCDWSQYRFIQEWFRNHIPLNHLDFTRVLPRFLSIYIFSFLDQKSLCRASKVSWLWKFISEQDVLWEPKCIRYGWFLPHSPEENTYGEWKRHYIGCAASLEYSINDNRWNELKTNLMGNASDGKKRKSSRKLSKLRSSINQYVLDARQPWQGPDKNPKDLEISHNAFLHECNPNEPKIPLSSTLGHNRWGIVKRPSSDLLKSLQSNPFVSKRLSKQHHLMEYDDQQQSQRINLSQSFDLENMAERRLKELVEQEWLPLTIRKSGTLINPLASNKPFNNGKTLSTDPHPRVIFISSRVPASEMLIDAVSLGVLPVVYEYEGETLLSLCVKLSAVLGNRKARSIGIFSHSDTCGQVYLVASSRLSLKTFGQSDVQHFIEHISARIVASNQNGQLDIFVPLAAYDDGKELLSRISALTGVTVSAPTGLIGAYNHKWSHHYGDTNPCQAYFCKDKLDAWSSVADLVTESSCQCRSILKPYFTELQNGLAAQIAGEILYDNVGLIRLRKKTSLISAVIEGLVAVSTETNQNSGLETLGNFLLRKSNSKYLKLPENQMMLSDNDPMNGEDKVNAEDEEIRNINSFRKQSHEEESYDDDVIEEDLEEFKPETLNGELVNKEEIEILEKNITNNGTHEHSDEVLKFHPFKSFQSPRFSSKLTPKQLKESPEKRTTIAREIQTSEQEYVNILDSVKKYYVRPLMASLSSNRSIISSHKIEIIFEDLLSIREESRILSGKLTKRLSDWDVQHTCLGDVFVPFCSRLKAYTNFFNNYSVILESIEKCREQSAMFRSFMQRNFRIPQCKMLTLQEILVLPSKRIEEYVKLLTWFKAQTPQGHADHGDLQNVIMTLTSLDHYIKECKQRVTRDREIVALQKTIVNCPSLLESNRYFVKHIDVVHLKPPNAGSISPEMRIYQEVGDVGLYLFNDALVFTRKYEKHIPFTRAIEYRYVFDLSLNFKNLHIDDVSDSKYLKNAFRISYPKRNWFCRTKTYEEKVSWISVLDRTIKSSAA